MAEIRLYAERHIFEAIKDCCYKNWRDSFKPGTQILLKIETFAFAAWLNYSALAVDFIFPTPINIHRYNFENLCR